MSQETIERTEHSGLVVRTTATQHVELAPGLPPAVVTVRTEVQDAAVGDGVRAEYRLALPAVGRGGGAPPTICAELQFGERVYLLRESLAQYWGDAPAAAEGAPAHRSRETAVSVVCPTHALARDAAFVAASRELGELIGALETRRERLAEVGS